MRSTRKRRANIPVQITKFGQVVRNCKDLSKAINIACRMKRWGWVLSNYYFTYTYDGKPVKENGYQFQKRWG